MLRISLTKEELTKIEARPRVITWKKAAMFKTREVYVELHLLLERAIRLYKVSSYITSFRDY